MIKVFNNIEEIKPYYNEKTNTYEFYDTYDPLDIEIKFNLNIASNLTAGNINALDIKANNIDVGDINANNIISDDINANDIKANNINALDINAHDIKANNIKAWNITANNINAWDINFYAICCAYRYFVCNSIQGRRKNSKYFSLDNSVIIKKEYNAYYLTEKLPED